MRELARKRQRQAEERAAAATAAAAAAAAAPPPTPPPVAPPPNGSASAVSLLLAHLGERDGMGPACWCVLAAVSREWRLCCSDGELWAAALWSKYGLRVATSEARAAYRRRHLAQAAGAGRRLLRAARRGDTPTLEQLLGRWGMPADVVHDGESPSPNPHLALQPVSPSVAACLT